MMRGAQLWPVGTAVVLLPLPRLPSGAGARRGGGTVECSHDGPSARRARARRASGDHALTI